MAFTLPNIFSLEKVLEYGISLSTGYVLGDLWGIHKFSNCNKCLDSRVNKINTMNTTQKIIESVECDCEMTLNILGV